MPKDKFLFMVLMWIYLCQRSNKHTSKQRRSFIYVEDQTIFFIYVEDQTIFIYAYLAETKWEEHELSYHTHFIY